MDVQQSPRDWSSLISRFASAHDLNQHYTPQGNHSPSPQPSQMPASQLRPSSSYNIRPASEDEESDEETVNSAGQGAGYIAGGPADASTSHGSRRSPARKRARMADTDEAYDYDPTLAHGHGSASPSPGADPYAAPRLPPIMQVEKQQVTTTATQAASTSRRKNEAHFMCPVPGCGSTFTRRFNLRGHLRSHTEDRPYVCEWPGCDKSFARQHDCKRHQTLHSAKSQANVCQGCRKAFSRLDALNRHREPHAVFFGVRMGVKTDRARFTVRSEGGAGCKHAIMQAAVTGTAQDNEAQGASANDMRD
ncbi:hypothetical protein PLICRDRAFT_483543 [Plicaturopsis crispa FD-325 SS-3]|nr:hypothetical protein PLICRDRAFT_483543 [Plicaturopsis crispa FD-325 SS-3]